MNATITATAHYVPEKVLTNHDLEKMIDTSDEWIQSRTGIAQRYIVGENEATSDLCTQIAKQLLEKRELSPDDIQVIIICTCTPDYFAPSTAALVQNNIGASNAWGFDLSGACTGFLYGLETGAKFIESGQYERVMVIGVDTMSSIIEYTARNTCDIFGAGGGGVLLEPTTNKVGILDSILHLDGSGSKFLHVPAGGSRKPASNKTVLKNQHVVYQDGKTIFKFAVHIIYTCLYFYSFFL